MRKIKAEFYRWNENMNVACPEWVSKALADGIIVIDGDDDAFVVTAAGRLRINPGAYLMHSMGVIFLVDADVYEAMVAQADVAPAAPEDDFAALDDDFKPPFSPNVLARSARAREMQADYDQAHVEGADTPDEPQEKTDGIHQVST
jgi:hypothetical protein